MTLPYLPRLIVLSVAAFFLIHLLLGLMIWTAAPAAIRFAERMKAHSAARFLLLLRFSAFGFAVVLTAAVCVPSYLRFEPQALIEPVGFACLAAAVLGLAVCAAPFVRGLGAIKHSARYVRECGRIGQFASIGGVDAYVLEGAAHCMLVAGIFRPRVILSSSVLCGLSTKELTAALLHERAHCLSRDNLKRLLMLLTPGILPFSRGFNQIERAWARVAERAADDSATLGHPARVLSLAEALVRVARLGNLDGSSPLMTSLLANGCDLAGRVERLLNKTPAAEPSSDAKLPRLTVATGFLLAVVLVFAMQTPNLLVIHAMLERLIH